MAQYIDKFALVAEITHKIKVLEAFIKNFDGISDKVEKAKNKIEALGDALLFIENLEVKKVDLEKHLKEDIEDVFYDLNGVAVKGATHCLTVEDVKDIAKRFYELGMAATNKAQKGE